MRYVSLFSGIEAASVAWEPLGWEAVAFAEIEPFPCEVLAQRFPDVPNLGDVTKIDWKEFLETYGPVDLVCGGSPCQSFSIAGGRESLDGESRLMFEYIRAVQELHPRWYIWENVPGVLNTKDDAFGCFLDQMDEIGYSTAWRVLDAQFFGVAQRRRRVWAVGASRDAFGDLAAGRAAAVLFERDSLRGNTQSSREKRQELAADAGKGAAASYTLKLRHTGSDVERGAGGVGALVQDDVSATLATSQDQTVFAYGISSYASNAMRSPNPHSGIYEAETSRTLDLNCGNPSCNQGGIAVVFNGATVTSGQNKQNPQLCDPCYTLDTDGRSILCIGSDTSKAAIDEDMASTLHVGGGVGRL